MTRGSSRISPNMMPRRTRSVPPASATPNRRHAFSPAVPRRGWPGSTVYADTGILLSAGRKRECVPKFTGHYADRLHVAENVAMEIARIAAPAAARWADGRAHTAAAVAKTSIIDAEKCRVDLDEYDSKVFDNVLLKLKNLPKKGEEPQHEFAHLGEAASIALCVLRIAEGQRVVFLVNDGGASLVASQHDVPARHFGHVLSELACAGYYTSEEAFDVFAYATAVSGVPVDAAPQGAKELECRRSSGSCGTCDSLAGSL